MATYFHGAPSEIQSDSLQTLYLMNPGYVGYSDAAAAAAAAAAPSNMLLFNSTMNPINPISQQQQQQQQQHFLGVPLQNGVPVPAPPQDSGRQYNLWTAVAEGRQPTVQQGLSLSLSSQQAAYAAAYQQSNSDVPNAVTVETDPPWTAATSSVSGMQGVLIGSKYLKAAQQLLDEVVNVGKGVKSDPRATAAAKSPAKSSRASEGGGDGDASSKRSTDLSTAERQELQMKKAKLVNMLDEVEQRYRQYRHQMQIVVSTFEAVAGPGSAKSYTALALQTISKQFRCLRDAISGQLKSTSKNLGEELDCVGVGGSSKLDGAGSSRLRLVDQHLRQQRALQQLGMIQHNVWRPQRGLPERSVSILRAWLFEHFLHPYPKDSDKLMLAKQTGLTRSQVSNWFINARVRLWKPMVEEMYLEEVKEHEENNGDDKSKIEHHTNVNGSEESSSKSSPSRTEQTHGGKEKMGDHSNPSLVINIPASALASAPTNCSRFNEKQTLMPSPVIKKARNDESIHASSLIHPDETSNCELLMKFGMVNQNAGFGGYSIGDIGRFDHEQFPPAFPGNGVSLTLGLPLSEDLSIPAAQPSYMGTDNLGIRVGSDFHPSITQPSSGYENLNMQNRKRFAAQLLPDFVS